MPAVRRVIGMVAAVGIAAVLVTAGSIYPPVAAADATLPGTALGVGRTITLPGSDGETTVVIPVPGGLAPIALRATVQVPSDVGRASLEVLAEGRVLSRTDVPTDVPNSPITLSLAGVPIVDASATISIRSTLRPVDDGWCTQDWWDQGMVLLDPAVDYLGDEAQPATIAEFLPPTLDELQIYVPQQPSTAESGAALELGAAIGARYSDVDPAVTLLAGSGPTEPPALLVRRVSLTESDDAAVILQQTANGPVLAITGSGDQLLEQARLVTNDLNAFAVTTRATVGALSTAPIYGPDTTTLDDLGQGTQTATATGRVSVRIGIDQTKLARPSGSVRLHLTGSYTPLPQTQNGQVVVRIGNDVVDHWPVTADGTIDRWIDIPDDDLRRYTDMTVTVETAGATTCGSTQPVTLTIDGSSVVTSSEATPPNPGGFLSLPQALMPQFDVGLAQGGFDDLRRAIAVTTALQRLTSMPLAPELVDYPAALDSSGPALVVSADGAPEGIDLPVTSTGDTTIEVTGTDGETESVDVPGLRYGSLQVAWDDGRTVVVATSNNSPQDLDRIFDWLGADPTRWGTVDGTAVIAAADAEPFAYGATTGGTAGAGNGGGAGTGEKIAIAVGIVAIVGGVIAALVIAVRNRRPHP